jgi:hypothetical protein
MKAGIHRIQNLIYVCWVLILLMGVSLACKLHSEIIFEDIEEGGNRPATTLIPTLAASSTVSSTAATDVPSPKPSNTAPAAVTTKWGLWVNGPHLRGVNIYQRRVYPELDGPTFMGGGPVGPPFSQDDFDRLSAMGANYVNISHPGLFSEVPPYQLDLVIQDNLDRLLEMIERADMYAVVSFRTGPGRSEFTFFWGEDDDWFDESYYNDRIWQDGEAQKAWGEMWGHTANRYQNNPIVVGYDLMVEPNSNEIWVDEWEPEAFYASYGGSSFDWNPLAARITAAIREVDLHTPILVGGNAYSAVEWLPYLQPTGDERTIYVVHQYAPIKFTHQDVGGNQYHYPGQVDIDWDGELDRFDRVWLESLLSIVEDYAAQNNVPVAVNEFGVMRWVPDGAAFLDDQMDLFEMLGMNYALWEWNSSWPEQAENNAFNFRFGPDPSNVEDLLHSDLLEIIQKYWRRNEIRPSNTPFR